MTHSTLVKTWDLAAVKQPRGVLGRTLDSSVHMQKTLWQLDDKGQLTSGCDTKCRAVDLSSTAMVSPSGMAPCRHQSPQSLAVASEVLHCTHIC